MSPTQAVTGRGVSVRRGRPAVPVLRDLTFDVPVGRVTGLIGPSGCGKTTLLRAVVDLQRHRGALTVLGEDAGSARLRGRIGYVTQSPSLYPELSVMENLGYFAQLSGMGKSAGAEAAVVRLGLTEVRHRRVRDLSGGQRGRTSLGCALVGDPDLLVMDEPTVGLDPAVRSGLWEEFRALAARGRSLLISSHVMEEAGRCDRVLLLREGRMIWQGVPSELLATTGTSNFEDAFLAAVGGRDRP